MIIKTFELSISFLYEFNDALYSMGTLSAFIETIEVAGKKHPVLNQFRTADSQYLISELKRSAYRLLEIIEENEGGVMETTKLLAERKELMEHLSFYLGKDTVEEFSDYVRLGV